MRFYLLDKINELVPEVKATGVKCVSLSDDIFNEHFPLYPIFPGTLIIEGLAQLSGILLSHSLIEGGYPYKLTALTLVKDFKFRASIHPGDRLIYTSQIKYFYPQEYAALQVKAERDGKLCAKGELLFGFLDFPDSAIEIEIRKNLETILRDYKLNSKLG